MAKLDLVVDAAVKGQNNLRGLAADLGAADKSASNLKTTLGKGLAFGAGFVGALGLKEGIEFLGDAVTKASEFENSMSAASQVMGKEAVPALEDWAKEAAGAFGASEQLAIDSAVQMSVFAKSAGLAGDEATGFAKEMTQLGGDLASFFGGSTEEAITAIGAALRGESEPIRRYGVLLDDATLRQRALKLGIIATTKQGLTPQQRVLAAQAEILEQTGDAQGDFLRTSEDMANVTKTVGAEFENIQKQIGEQLLPFFKDIAVFIRDTLIPTFGALGDVSDFISDLVNPLGAVLERQDDELKAHQQKEAKRLKAGEDAWMSYTTAISTASDEVKDRVRDLTDSEIAQIRDHWDEIRAAGHETVVQYNAGIFDAQDDLKTEIEALLKSLDEHLAPGEEIAYLRGQKVQLMLARGIAEEQGDKGAVAKIDLLLADINARLSVLGSWAYDSGANIVTAMVNGMRREAAIQQANGNLWAIGNMIRAGVGINSEPEDPRSPLSGITTWGANIVHTITDGMLGELGAARGATNALASALVPTSSQGGLQALGSGGTVVNINLQVDGDLRASEETLPGTLARALYVSGADEYLG